MAVNKRIEYTPEQLEKANQMAQFLKDSPKEKQKIIVMMSNAFVSGLEVGLQYPENQKSKR